MMSTGPLSSIIAPGRRRGFTLIEILVVILIILLVSAVALPTVLPALNHRQVSEAARILQGALVGARDRAIHDGQPSGIRLLPDPNFAPQYTTTGVNIYSALAYDRIVPISQAPEYTEGFCTPIVPNTFSFQGATLTLPSSSFPTQYSSALMLIENPVNPQNMAPNPPTNWFWNVRVGDKIQLNNAGPWYTIIGPMVIGPAPATSEGITTANTELFVNAGPPTSLANLNSYGALPILSYPSATGGKPVLFPVEYLILVNGQDDNGNGWIDEGFDGVDNNGIEGIDEYMPGVTVTVNKQSVAANEWEPEVWLGSVLSNGYTNSPVPYTIQRRPAPAPGAREIALPTQMVIDATTMFLDKERSRLPVNTQTQYSGIVDIVLNPDGTVLPTLSYSSPTSYTMDQAFYHFWLAERQDVASVQLKLNTDGSVAQPPTPIPLFAGSTTTTPHSPAYYLPVAPQGGLSAGTFPGPYLQGEYTVITLNGRTGQVGVNANPPFFYDSILGYTNQPGSSSTATYSYNPIYPFIQAEQGLFGGP